MFFAIIEEKIRFERKKMYDLRENCTIWDKRIACQQHLRGCLRVCYDNLSMLIQVCLVRA